MALSSKQPIRKSVKTPRARMGKLSFVWVGAVWVEVLAGLKPQPYNFPVTFASEIGLGDLSNPLNTKENRCLALLS